MAEGERGNVTIARTIITLAVAIIAFFLGCGGQESTGGSSAAAPVCRDQAFRIDDYASVTCDATATVTIRDGWVLCRCKPESPSLPPDVDAATDDAEG